MQKYFFILSALLLSIVSSTAEQLSNNSPSASDSIKIDNLTPFQTSIADSIVNYGKLFLNKPYRYGSPGTDSFDCSGFTSFVYRNFGYTLQRSSADQALQFDSVDRRQLKMGDLVFFSGRSRSKRVGHVGIVTKAKENGQFEFIHAAVHSGVTISNSEEAYYTKRYIKAKRVIGYDRLLGVVPYLSKTENTVSETKTTIPFSTEVKQTRKFIPAEYHRVKSGETLSSIAHKYGISITELKRKNDLKGNKIKRKQQLKIKDEETIMVIEPLKDLANNPTEITNKTKNDNSEVTSVEPTVSTPTSVSHIIKKGETLFSISKLYKISVEELKKINKLQTGNIRPGQELKISQISEPISNVALSKSEIQKKVTTHKVISGESLFSIAKMYNVTTEELKKINDLTRSNIHAGQEIIIYSGTEIAKADLKTNTNLKEKEVVKKEVMTPKNKIYKVKKGESLISIAKDFNMSVEDLKKMNNLTDNKIKFGQELVVSQSVTETTKSTTSKVESKPKSFHHKVKSGESYYSIAKKYGCTMNELKEWNNKSGSKLNIGDEVVFYKKARI
ncbi:MAG TPA: LysM peptidoglycan-binding domain-containing protein [Paludibacter sp.]